MSRRSPQQPNSRSPVSKDVVEIVKKKVTAPSGPPPSNMTAFTAPKISYRSPTQDKDYIDNDDDYDDRDDDDGDYDYRSPKTSRSARKEYHDDDDDPMDAYYGSHQTTGASSNSKPSNRRLKASYDEDDDDDIDSEDYRHQPKSSSVNQRSSNPTTYRSTEPESSRRSDFKTDQRPTSTNRRMSNSDDKSNVLDRRNARGPQSRFPGSPPKSTSSAASSPSKQNVFNFQPLLKATYRDLRNFAWTPCEQGVLVRCYIERDRTGRVTCLG
jgi:hypothetical protein